MTWPTGRRAGIYRLAVSNQFGTDERAIEIGIHGNSSLIPVRSKSSYEFPSGSSDSVTNGPNQQQGNTENNNSSVSDLFLQLFYRFRISWHQFLFGHHASLPFPML